MVLADAIRQIRFKVGLQQKEFAEAIGVSAPYISQLESGKRAGLSAEIASAIHVKFGYEIVFLEGNEVALTSNEQKTYSFMAREPDTPYNVKPVQNQDTGDVIVPVLVQDIHAGDPHPIITDESESFNVTRHYRNTIVVRVVGDSMVEAGIDDGDKVIIRKQPNFKDGQIVLAQIENELTLKFASAIDDKIRFTPANEAYQPWSANSADVMIIGVAIETIKKTRGMKIINDKR